MIELLTGKPPYSHLMQYPAMYRISQDDNLFKREYRLLIGFPIAILLEGTKPKNECY